MQAVKCIKLKLYQPVTLGDKLLNATLKTSK